MDNDLENINLSDLTDQGIASLMRKANYEKFKAMVRMHLSFELDLNTDEFDLPCHEIVYEDKGKLKKWHKLSSKKHYKMTTSNGGGQGSGGSTTTGCGGGMKSAGNSPSEGLQQQIDAGFLFHLEEIKQFLMLEKNLIQEGIFRKTGSVSRQNELRLHIQNDQPLNLAGGGYSAHDCATVFKGYLAELPEPLLTDAHYPAHLQISPLCLSSTSTSASSADTSMRPPNPERVKREQHLLNSIQLLLLLLPEEQRQLLQHIIEILHAVAMHSPVNKMSSTNLATLFAPHLICPRNLPPEALHYLSKKMSSIVAYMITKGMDIFDIPAKLSTDIRAYFLDRKRKKTMSPEQELDDSVTDIRTVYSFVDREKTAAAHTANTTDTELAQLYAHIQSLPESSKKRRLIKQFNKQNGQGTPLQIVVMNRLKNSEASRSAKSIGDSIKKHIFHKSIICRTPKRITTQTMGPETPNLTNLKLPNQRALFRSPAQDSITSKSSASSYALPSTTTTELTASVTKTMHTPLTKSISSTSLHAMPFHHYHQQQQHEHDHDHDTVSAPVSRQTSSDFPQVSDSSSSSSNMDLKAQHMHSNTMTDSSSGCCVTPLKLISEAAKHLIGAGGGVGGGGGDKKSVAWNLENQLLEIEEDSYPNTPKEGCGELKSRYKSEPNLSCMQERSNKFEEARNNAMATALEPDEMTPLHNRCTKSLTRKLMKGVSMGNLKFPTFATPESTKKLVRSVSSTLKRRSSEDNNPPTALDRQRSTSSNVIPKEAPPSQPIPQVLVTDIDAALDLDDDTFEDDPADDVDGEADGEDESAPSDIEHELAGGASSSNRGESNSASNEVTVTCSSSSSNMGTMGAYQQLLLQQLTSTPSSSVMMGRRSMSPITKSTQRMPKAMQESIMTPRSRKPVMLLNTNLGSSSLDPNQTLYQDDLTSFREQDEDTNSLDNSHHVKTICKQQPPNLHSEDAILVGDAMLLGGQGSSKDLEAEHALTTDFKEYLRSRSVLTASPLVEDSSFSSHPDDDFASVGSKELEDFDESQLSHSLLYCLDGNEPGHGKDAAPQHGEGATLEGERPTSSRRILNTIQNSSGSSRAPTNNARKRAASQDLDKFVAYANASSSTSLSSPASAASSSNAKATENKENYNQNIDEGFALSKKLLIREFPGETSF